MATITLYGNRINQMPGFIRDVKKSVNSFKSELSSLRQKTLGVNSSVCNLDDVVSSIQASSQTQERKAEALDAFAKKNEEFISDTYRIDREAGDIVGQRKDDFYKKYSYLKPDSEKNWFENACEKFGEWCKKVGDWCKEHWDILAVVGAIVVAVAIVVVSILTFGAATVGLAALVGAIVGGAGQFVSDVVSWSITGKWNGTIQSYAGAIFGGALGGILTLTGNVVLASAFESGYSTLLGQSLENLTGTQKRPFALVMFNTAFDAPLSVILSIGFKKLSSSSAKYFSKHFSVFRRLSGRGSYGAAFNMVLTKLKKEQIAQFTFKSVRNGVFSGLAGSFFENIFKGFKNVILDKYLDFSV